MSKNSVHQEALTAEQQLASRTASASHTPGPWTTNVLRLSDGSIAVAHILGPQGQGLAQIGIYPSEAETLANLNLFAAASDMLAALQFYANAQNYKQIPIPSRGFSVSETAIDGGERARAAVAKAGPSR